MEISPPEAGANHRSWMQDATSPGRGDGNVAQLCKLRLYKLRKFQTCATIRRPCRGLRFCLQSRNCGSGLHPPLAD